MITLLSLVSLIPATEPFRGECRLMYLFCFRLCVSLLFYIILRYSLLYEDFWVMEFLLFLWDIFFGIQVLCVKIWFWKKLCSQTKFLTVYSDEQNVETAVLQLSTVVQKGESLQSIHYLSYPGYLTSKYVFRSLFRFQNYHRDIQEWDRWRNKVPSLKKKLHSVVKCGIRRILLEIF